MPLTEGASVSDNIHELHTGKTFERTKHKFGKKRADKQAVAIALRQKRKDMKRHGKKRHGKRGAKSGRY